MKILTSTLLATAVLFVAGCQQSSTSSDNTPDTNSTAAEMKTNVENTMSEASSNVVSTATNVYMSATNAVLTNSAATNNP
jgi:hypothetical protein